jgi:hypothetical protein
MGWFKNNVVALSMALNNVEKNSLSQEKNSLAEDTSHNVEKDSHSLLVGLKNGVVNEEVKRLRWRQYKILQALDDYKIDIVGEYEDEDGNMRNITKTTKINNREKLSKVIVDSYDDYKLEISLNNKEIYHIDDTNKTQQINKIESNVILTKNSFPRVNIENFITKLNVRAIDENKKMVEFYVSKYENKDIPFSRIFINELLKVQKDKLSSNILDIKEIEFTSDSGNAIGVDDFMKFKYEVINFDKIIEFDGNYVIKFICNVLVNGENAVNKYIDEELELKYQNKEPKKIKKNNLIIN